MISRAQLASEPYFAEMSHLSGCDRLTKNHELEGLLTGPCQISSRIAEPSLAG